MRVLVLGAGLTGVTSAWYLAAAGHEVEVVERQPAAALETSFANGGQISVSHPEPWANPGAPAQILRWLGREDAPLKFRPRPEIGQWLWGVRFLLECLPGRNLRNGEAIARLAIHSRARLRELRAATGIEYDSLQAGILHLFFDDKSFAQAEDRARWLRGLGMKVEVLDRAGCVSVEPALAGCRDRLLGGIHAPEDESGDAHRFTRNLAQMCAQRGVRFHYDTLIEAIEVQAGRVAGIRAAGSGGRHQTLAADAYLLCAGSFSPLLAAAAGERLPIYPVKGYSVTLPLAEPSGAPRTSITDESRRIVVSRLGGRLRAAGTAELTGYDTQLNAARCGAILDRLLELFPDIRSSAEAECWAGLRPATPSNLPIIGRSRLQNLFFNT
ncbi:MAG TPA: D-amino acid dehydrogenase, partial [Rhodocyclaceae bacterium]|nr:D-amino acid dehydrogenase [Rhodocyclaceae bacterium]